MDIWSFVWSNGIGWIIAGIALYLLDKQWGVRVYRYLYDLFHKAPMPADVVRGFLVNQKTAPKATRIVIFSTVVGFIQGFYTPGVNIISQLIMTVLQMPALCVGLILGWVVYKILPYRDRIFATADKIGETASKQNVGEMARRATTLGGSIVETVLDVPHAIKNMVAPEPLSPPTPPAPQASEVPITPAPAPTVEPAESAISRFTKRNR
jgi:hypothetical protein